VSTCENSPQANSALYDIKPYVPGKSKAEGGKETIKLSSNETPFGASPLAIKAFTKACESLEIYPDGSARALREALGAYHGIDPDNIVCGAGSDEVLNLLAQAYLSKGDEAIYTEHGFLVYPIAIMANEAIPVIAEETNLTADVDKILACVSDKTRLVFLANPNNPTGTYLPGKELERLRASLPEEVILVIDGAYAEYVSSGDYDAGIDLVSKHKNVVMTRTFSKVYGLASLRLGWAYCPDDIADVLNRIRGPFNVSGPAIAAGVASIEDDDFMQQSTAHNTEWLGKMSAAMAELGIEVTPSVANFLLLHFSPTGEKTAALADEYLLQNGIVVRRLENYKLPNALRATIGSKEANEKLIAALSKFMSGETG